MVKKINQYSQSGFSLLEVLVATTIFSVFAAMYVASEGGNMADSLQMREELILKNLAEDKINSILENPPDLRESLLISKETKTFDQNPNYSYTIEWKKLDVPDMSAASEEEEDSEENSQNSFKSIIMQKVKENMEKLIWQVKVTITNKETKFFYTVSSWVYNHKVQVNIDGL